MLQNQALQCRTIILSWDFGLFSLINPFWLIQTPVDFIEVQRSITALILQLLFVEIRSQLLNVTGTVIVEWYRRLRTAISALFQQELKYIWNKEILQRSRVLHKKNLRHWLFFKKICPKTQIKFFPCSIKTPPPQKNLFLKDFF